MRVLIVGEGPNDEAVLRTLVSRVLGEKVEVTFRKVSESVQTTRLKGEGSEKRAVAWIREAQRANFSALVLVIDNDNQNDRVTQLDRAQTSGVASTPRALGVAVESIEAWILADDQAFSQAAEVKPENFPVSPEKLSKAKLKPLVDHLLTQSKSSRSSDFYSDVVQMMRTDIVAKKCPLGFAPFYARLNELALSQ